MLWGRGWDHVKKDVESVSFKMFVLFCFEYMCSDLNCPERGNLIQFVFIICSQGFNTFLILMDAGLATRQTHSPVCGTVGIQRC